MINIRTILAPMNKMRSAPSKLKRPPISPELQVVLICARLNLAESDIFNLETLTGRSLNWPLILQRAGQHGLLGLMYQHLSRHCPHNVPNRILGRLQHYSYNVTGHNVSLAKEMLRLLRALEAQGVQAVPYKGPIIAETIYGDLALRKFNDLDILVQPHDVRRATKILIEHGYDLDPTYWSSGEAANPTKSRNRNVVNLNRRDGNVALELHWRFCPPLFLTIDLGQLWPRLKAGTLLTHPIRIFPPEDLLVILCIHGAKDWWERLEWLVGVAELIRQRPNLAWPTVFSRAEELGAARMVRLGLALVCRLLAVDLPDAVRTKLCEDASIEAVAQKMADRLTRDQSQPLGPFTRWWFHFKLMPHFRQRLRFSFQLLYNVLAPTSIEKQRYRLPDHLFWFYYVLRPVGLTTKYSKIWAERLRTRMFR
ncbi:MAG: nucleotidyltransferase family protein [Anaerolineae bacterium]|nr:nucleotidyltransferase family protein [Anaerolineae bacterium]